MKAAPAAGTSRKHAGSAKAGATAKHRPAAKPPAAKAAKPRATAVAKSPSHAKPRALSPGSLVACCPAEALAASLRLAGWPVAPEDVLDLYARAADGPSAGFTIASALEAAARHGLAGVRPLGYAPLGLDDPAAVLLGLDLPGAHAVCAEPGGWWTWGELHDPGEWPDAVVEEAWAVMWP